METIKKEYLVLFNAIVDLEGQLETMRQSLLNTLQKAEDIYINSEEESTSQKVS